MSRAPQSESFNIMSAPVTGTGLKSEYQRSFGKDKFVCAATTYRNNRMFRHEQERRSRGSYHDAFIWENDDDNLSGPEERFSSEHEDACFDRRQPLLVAPHQVKHVRWNRLHEARRTRSLSDDLSDTSKNSKNDERFNSKYDSSNESDGDAVIVHVVNAGGGDKQTQTPSIWHQSPKPPFLPYGYHNEELEIGAQKTFNVRAAKEIFPSALRAMRHREEHNLAIPQHQGHPHQTSSTELEVGRHPQQSQWLTEYGRAFKSYSPSQFQHERVERAARVKSPDLLPSAPRVHRDYLYMSP